MAKNAKKSEKDMKQNHRKDAHAAAKDNGTGATAKEEQHQFAGAGMEPDACGKAVLAYIECDKELKTEFKKLKETRGKAEQKVIEELKKSKRNSISIDGFTVQLFKTEGKEGIKIKGPRLNEEA